MKLNHLFYDSSVNYRNISISKVVMSIVIGVSSAIVIYSFFYVLRETFRLMSIGFGNTPLILSEVNRNFYNLFFSGLSVIFGNSIAISFIFSKPQRIVHRFNSKRKRLLNDQVFLSFNFSYWFAKIGLVFGIFSMCCMDFEFMPYFKHISILLLVVLYLESFKSLGLLLKNSQRLRFIFIHFLTLIVLTFLLSKINVVDYKKLDQNMLEVKPIIDFPYSNFYNDDKFGYRNSLEIKLMVEGENNIFVFVNERKWKLENVPSIIDSERSSMREELIHFLKVIIIADKNTKISDIKKLELLLFSVNQRMISYTVSTDDLLFSRFERRGIRKLITQNILNIKNNIDNIQYLEIPYQENTNLNDTIKITVEKKALFWKNEILNNNIELENRLAKTHLESTIFEYNYQSDVTFQEYISVLAAHFSTVEKLRKEKQTIFKKNQYERNESYNEEQKKLRESFPIFILEKFN